MAAHRNDKMKFLRALLSIRPFITNRTCLFTTFVYRDRDVLGGENSVLILHKPIGKKFEFLPLLALRIYCRLTSFLSMRMIVAHFMINVRMRYFHLPAFSFNKA